MWTPTEDEKIGVGEYKKTPTVFYQSGFLFLQFLHIPEQQQLLHMKCCHAAHIRFSNT